MKETEGRKHALKSNNHCHSELNLKIRKFDLLYLRLKLSVTDIKTTLRNLRIENKGRLFLLIRLV